MPRTVFSTTTKPAGASGDGQASVALEVGISEGKGIVLFRERGGAIFDISSTVTVTGTEPCNLVRALPADATNIPPVGFTINVSKLTVENEATFTGTLQRRTGPSPADVTNLAWEGTFTMFSDINIETIQEGIKPLPPAVLKLLVISALDNEGSHEDRAMKSTQSKLKELMTYNLDSWARDWFFHNKDAQLNANCFPPEWGQVPDTFQLAKISSDNHDFLFKAGMHLVCRSLKNAGWLDHEFRDRIKDKVDDFFASIKEGKDTALTQSYDDCTRRVYMSCFLSAASAEWRDVLVARPAATTLSETVATLSTPNFLAHWVPQNLVAPGFEAGAANMPLKARLAELKCKLTLLKAWVKNDNKVDDKDEEVQRLIEGIQRAAKMSGLIGNVTPDPQAAEFNFEIKAIFSDSLEWKISMAQQSPGGGFFAPQIDTKSASVHFWLLDDANKLGLYD